MVKIPPAENGGDELNWVPHARKAAPPSHNCRGFDTRQRRGRGRGQNIFNIVIAPQADILAAKENGLCAIAPENNFIVTQETAAGHAFLPTEPENRRAGPRGPPARRRAPGP